MSLIFNTFQSAINITQFQIWSFLSKQAKLYPYFFAKSRSFSSLINLQSKSINFKFGHCWAKYQGYSLTALPKIAHFHHFSICNQNQSISNLVIFDQNTKAIALLFRQISLIFITFQSAIKINQFQIWSFFSKIPGYSLTFLPKIAHFHHFSICNQNQSISKLVISPLFNLQSTSINVKFGHFWAKYQGFSLTFSPQIPHCHHFSIWTKYQGYSLTFSPNIAHFHHFSICNHNHSISNLVISEQNTKAIALLFRQISLIFFPLFNLQSTSINVKFGHFWAKYQGYSLTFSPNIAHFHHFSICNHNHSMSNLVISEQNTKAIALLFPPNVAHFQDFSICNQNQSISNLVIFEQNTKAIALCKITRFYREQNIKWRNTNKQVSL